MYTTCTYSSVELNSDELAVCFFVPFACKIVKEMHMPKYIECWESDQQDLSCKQSKLEKYAGNNKG